MGCGGDQWSFVVKFCRMIAPAGCEIQPASEVMARGFCWRRPFDPALRDLRMNRAAARFTSRRWIEFCDATLVVKAGALRTCRWQVLRTSKPAAAGKLPHSIWISFEIYRSAGRK